MNIKRLKNFYKNKRVFVTGHTGFKGTWLCLILNYLGANVTGYSLRQNPHDNFYFYKAINLNKKCITPVTYNFSNLLRSIASKARDVTLK